ncbi:MAG: ATP-binding protein [Chlamydiales bacterium]|nr:ATP-binding protein [Chlamydiales bacterium]
MQNESNQRTMKNVFIGRKSEKAYILEAANSGEASILVVYGRRRVGKTELIEQTLQTRGLIKLEGVEDGNTQAEMYRVLYQLSKALNDEYITRMQFKTWLELFDFIASKLPSGKCTLYLEELQWLAEYKNELISDLKYVWDNKLRHKSDLLVVLCGSSPSFMLNQVVHSKALYNRSMYEINLTEFSLGETQQFLANRAQREVMDAYLTVGGIPEYLKRIKKHSSIQIGICEESFKKNSYFSTEKNRIFISSFASNVHYEEIIDYLSQVKFASKKEIEEKLHTKGGGTLTAVLKDLELCGFIERYQPYQADSNSNMVRYCIADSYLRFYFKFIAPLSDRIQLGDYNLNPVHALNKESYQKWLGLSFERFCRKNSQMIATIIGFSAVRYKSGAFFNRTTIKEESGYQIDLIFDRADYVLTICEIKYTQSKVGIEVIDEVEKKLRLMPDPKGKTIEKVLISASGATDALLARSYFDRIITLEDIFKASI